MRFRVAISVLFMVVAGCGQTGGGTSSTPLATSPPTSLSSSTTPPPSTTVADTTTSTTSTTVAVPIVGEPSQSPADAERDRVVPALAALPTSLRVDPELTVPTEEGLWVLSRPKPETMDLAPGCGLGGPDGVYGRDIICVAEYGEVLLMDPTGERILRAYPLPGLPPYHLVVTDAAVFCGRWGDGALPDSMLCRIDRTTLDWIVRVFPWYMESGFTELSEMYIPDNWTIDDPIDASYFEHLEMTEAGLTVEGWGGKRLVDPTTLDLQEPAQ